jgi:Na+-driven multidrug efflux pump
MAMRYSNIGFFGAPIFWVLMLMQAALRAAGRVTVSARIILVGVLVGFAASPALVLGQWSPPLGVAGAGCAQVLCYLVGLILAHIRSSESNLRLRRFKLTVPHFRAILDVGLPSTGNA